MVCFYVHWFQDNRTALDIAVQLNHVLVAELLLDRGASFTGCNKVSISQAVLYHSKLCPFSFMLCCFQSGESLLMRAVAAGHVEMVSLLLEEGADVAYINPVSVFFVDVYLSCMRARRISS